MTAAKREEELCNEIQDVIDKYNDLTATRRIGCLETVKGVTNYRVCKTAEGLQEQMEVLKYKSTTEGLPIYPVFMCPEIMEVMTGDIKRKENKPVIIPDPIKTKHDWYDCVIGSNCEEVCDHKTKKEALEHAKELLKVLNKPCEDCGDGTLVANCPLVYHKMPKAKWTPEAWGKKNG